MTGLVAFVVYEGSRPVLYTQALDGTDRQRLSLDGVRAGYPREQVFDHNTGEYVDAVPVPRDERVLALNGPLRWSADGRRLAFAAVSAFDQAEAVVLGLDGQGHGASPTVATVTAPTFSADGRRLAYGLWTNQDARFFLLTTDLTTFATTQTETVGETNNASTFWWAPDGHSVLFSRPRFSPAPEYRPEDEIRRVDLQTGAISAVTGTLSGHIVDHDPATGTTLLRRFGSGAAATSVLRRADGSESSLPEGQHWVGFAAGRPGYAVTRESEAGSLQIVPTDGGEATALAALPPDAHAAVWVDL